MKELVNLQGTIGAAEAAWLASVAIAAATGQHPGAVHERLSRVGGWYPLAELGGAWAPPPRRSPGTSSQWSYTGSYLTVNEYAEDWGAMPDGVDSPEDLARHLVRKHDPEKLLWSLARMNQLSSKVGNPPGIIEGYREHLPERWRPAFDRAVRRQTGGLGVFVAFRQPLLAAMRYVLTTPPEDLVGTEPASLSTAIMLSHAVGVRLDHSTAEEEERKDPDKSFMEASPGWAQRIMVGSGLLAMHVDMLHYLFRTLNLWRDCGPRLKRYKMEKEPAEILRDATGVELEDLLGAGILAWAHEDSWTPDTPQMKATVRKGGEVSPETLEAFLRLVTATPEELNEAFAGRTGPYDYFPLQSRPVMRQGDDLIVLDKDFLLERFTSGLYYDAFNHVKANQADPEKLPMKWVQAFGEMFELSIEEQVLAMAPEEGPAGKTVVMEEDMKKAYGKRTKRPDIAVYYGPYLVIFEIVSGRLRAEVRSGGDLAAFEKDVEKMVAKKFRQLGDACQKILADETRLTGRPPTANLRIVPVVVQADVFPTDAITLDLQKKIANRTGLFDDPRIVEPSAIGPTELDMLEGLHDKKGIEPHIPLRAWKQRTNKISLRNFLLEHYGRGPAIYRSRRMVARVEAASVAIQDRIRAIQDTS